MNIWTNTGKLKKGFVLILALVLMLQFTAVQPMLGAGEEFSITWIDRGTVKEGTLFDFTLGIQELTSANAADDYDGYYVSIEGSYDQSSNSASDYRINWINGDYGTVKLKLKYDGGNRTDITVKIFDASNNQIDANKILGATIKVPVETSSPSPSPTPDPIPVDTSKYVPVLNIVNSSMPSGSAGWRLMLNLEIKNNSNHTAKKIRVKPELPEGSPFTIDTVSPVQMIETLEPNTTTTLTYYFRISDFAAPKVYPIQFNFEYYNLHGDFYGGGGSPRSEVIYVKVNNNQSAPHLNVSGIRILSAAEVANAPLTDENGQTAGQGAQSGTGKVLPDNVLTAELKLANLGTLDAHNVRVTLGGLRDDGFGLYQDTNLKTFDRLSGGGEVKLRYALLPSPKLGKGNYALSAKIEYQDAQGENYTLEHQFFVPLNNAVNASSVPKIILNQYSCDPGIVKAGEIFNLNLSFLNTSKDKTVQNIKIYFTVPDGGANSSGSVFTPVNSSNTFFIDSIGPKGTYNKTLQFYTIPDATPKTYTLTANFEYEDENGTEYKATELIGVPVSQQVKIETSEIVFPPEVFLGEPLAVSMDFYNTGKARLSNLMIKLEGDFDTQNANYYVGNFEVGSSDYYEGMIYPNAPGLLTGAVVISFDDPSGEHMEVRKEFSVNVVEMPMPEFPPDYMPPDMPGQSTPMKTYIIVGAAVLAAVIGAVVLYKKVIKKVISRKKGIALDE